MNLVTVNCSFKHHNTTATKRTKKDAGIERSKTKKKQEKKTATEKRKERKKIVSRALIHITSISLCHLILGR